ncbi:unnamed protein product [Acanthoscelides obtectus]|uniref:Uncharacterized protein n=1 Tax=Acanthoscelides obtectus TaxID=200917 RepID=A0A9P0M8K2_ACAOB|nr:unnamed protein product [Acanthoscelides obtectus]CAK1682217.1 hypothetical protein AOBTE_LOCUS33490 [Acanthoscelides obtectus]
MIGEALEVGSDSRYQCSTSRTIASGVETVRQTTEGPERSSPGNSESPTDSGSGDPCEAALTTITFKHPAESTIARYALAQWRLCSLPKRERR